MVTASLFFAMALLLMMAAVSAVILFRGSDIDLLFCLDTGLATFALVLLLVGSITKDATLTNLGVGFGVLTLGGATAVVAATREARE